MYSPRQNIVTRYPVLSYMDSAHHLKLHFIKTILILSPYMLINISINLFKPIFLPKPLCVFFMSSMYDAILSPFILVYLIPSNFFEATEQET